MARDMNSIAGSHDLVLIVLDTLRHDVAVTEMEEVEKTET
jgi:hypothetical protein